MHALKRKWVLLILILGVVPPLFLQLGNRGLNEPDEGRYTEMSREMLVTGDWLVPRLNGVPHYAKPPWIYWCVASSLQTFGLNEWAARLPSATAALITALTVFAMGRRMGGDRAGLISALVLVTSLLFLACGRLITPDMMLTAFITLALYCFWRWWTGGEVSRNWLLGFYLSLGLGFFDKGPYGIIIPIASILPFLLWRRRPGSILRMGWWWGIIVVALIALPWFIWICRENPDLYDFYLKGEIAARATTGRGRSKAWWYFLAVLPLACWPWTALVIHAIGHHLRRIWKMEAHGVASQFLFCGFLIPLFIYSAVPSKLPTYILPILPPLALLTGTWIARCMEEPVPFPRWGTGATFLLLSLLPIALWVFSRRTLPEMSFIWLGLILSGIILSALAWGLTTRLSTHLTTRSRFVAWWVMAVLVTQITIAYTPRLESEFRHNSSWRELTEPIAGLNLVGVPIPTELHPTGKKAAYLRPGPRVAMYEFYFRSSSFYLMDRQREIVPQFGGDSLWEIEADKQGEAKLTRDDLVELLKGPETVYVFTRPQYRFELQELTGRQLPLMRSASTGNYQAILFTNKPDEVADKK